MHDRHFRPENDRPRK